MQPGRRILIGAALVVGLLAMGWFAADRWMVRPPSNPDPICAGRLLPPALSGGEAESLTIIQAQARSSYAIPLPQDYVIQQVWVWDAVGPGEKAGSSVAIRFVPDLVLVIQPQATPPDWEETLKGAGPLKRVSDNAIAVVGADPGYTLLDVLLGRQCPRAGALGWWVGGLGFTLQSNTLSLGVLLEIARGMHPVLPLPADLQAVVATIERAYLLEAQAARTFDLSEFPDVFSNDPRWEVGEATIQTVRELTRNPDLETAGYLDYKLAYYSWWRDGALRFEAVHATAEAEGRGLTVEESRSLVDETGRVAAPRRADPIEEIHLDIQFVHVYGDLATVILDDGPFTSEKTLVLVNGHWYIAGSKNLASHY